MNYFCTFGKEQSYQVRDRVCLSGSWWPLDQLNRVFAHSCNFENCLLLRFIEISKDFRVLCFLLNSVTVLLFFLSLFEVKRVANDI
jgi:hypothetical protein